MAQFIKEVKDSTKTNVFTKLGEEHLLANQHEDIELVYLFSILITLVMAA